MKQETLRMKTIPLIIMMICGLNLNAQVNILDCLELKDSIFGKYQSGEHAARNEVIDIENGYYALEWYEEDKEGNIHNYVPLFQAAIFKNFDEKWSLGITEYHADEQCYWYKSYFYEISKNLDRITEIELSSILPELNWDNFLSESLSKGVLEKYLPEIKEKYLDANATIDDVLHEVYDFHYIMPRKGVHVKVELTICDYISLNVVGFDSQDWEIIEQDFKTLVLKYNRQLKAFELHKTKTY